MVDKTSATAAPAAKTLEARYTRPFQAHGSIGPSCAVAQWTDGKLRVWTHSQGVYPLRGDLANVFGIEPAAVRCTHAEGAGCYGHNGADDVALDAALLARATSGRPVKLQWMRDDEFMWEPYGSAMVMKLGGALDAQGNIVELVARAVEPSAQPRARASRRARTRSPRATWRSRSAPRRCGDVPLPSGGSDRNAIPRLRLPEREGRQALHRRLAAAHLGAAHARRLRQRVRARVVHGRAGRSPPGVDPVEFRLRHMKDPRARAVIEATAAQGRLEAAATATGWGFGYARYKNIGCYCAVAAEVERRSRDRRGARAARGVRRSTPARS